PVRPPVPQVGPKTTTKPEIGTSGPSPTVEPGPTTPNGATVPVEPPSVPTVDTTNELAHERSDSAPDVAVEPDRELMESIARYTFASTAQPKTPIAPGTTVTDGLEPAEHGLALRAPVALSGALEKAAHFPGTVRHASE